MKVTIINHLANFKGSILISHLLVDNLFVHSLPDMILLYMATLLHQRCFCMRFYYSYIHLGHCYQFYKGQHLLICVGKGLSNKIHQKERNVRPPSLSLSTVPKSVFPAQRSLEFPDLTINLYIFLPCLCHIVKPL